MVRRYQPTQTCEPMQGKKNTGTMVAGSTLEGYIAISKTTISLMPPSPPLFGLPSFHLWNACIRIPQHAYQCNSYPALSQKNHPGILPNETQLQLLSLSPATFIKYATIELNLSSKLGNSNTCFAGLGLAQPLQARLAATYTAEEKCRLLARRCIWIPPICVHVNRC